MRLPRHIALCLLLLLPFSAHADDIGPAQAAALRQQITDWLASLLGPAITLPDLGLQVTGEGDHYRLTLPIPGLDDPASGAVVTASIKPLDGGRWSIDGLDLPDAANFTVTMPDAVDKAAGGPTKVAMTVGKQDSHAVIDPALTTASTMHIDMHDIAVTTDSPAQHQEQKIARYAVDSGVQPGPDGRLALNLDATMEGWQSAATVHGDAAMAFGAQKMHATGKIDGVSRERATALLTAISALVGALPPGPIGKDAANLPPAVREQLHGVIDGLSDVLHSVRLEESIDGLQVEVAGMGGLAVQHMLFGFGGEAPDGRLHIWLDVGVDGLDTPTLPPTMTAFLPKHIALRPSLSGIQTADLRKLAADAADSDGDNKALEPDLAAIFAHGGIDLGVETLAFDVGPAKIEGVGHLIVLSPKTWRGKARLTASGLDELTAQAKSHPELQQALPVLVMLRGLAKPDGKQLVWEIASDGGAVTVNGLDLSQLGGGKPNGNGQPRKR